MINRRQDKWNLTRKLILKKFKNFIYIYIYIYIIIIINIPSWTSSSSGCTDSTDFPDSLSLSLSLSLFPSVPIVYSSQQALQTTYCVHTFVWVSVYMYACACVCVCVRFSFSLSTSLDSRTFLHLTSPTVAIQFLFFSTLALQFCKWWPYLMYKCKIQSLETEQSIDSFDLFSLFSELWIIGCLSCNLDILLEQLIKLDRWCHLIMIGDRPDENKTI